MHNNTGGKRWRDSGSLKTEQDDLIMINYRCCGLLLQRVKVICHLNTIRLTLTY